MYAESLDTCSSASKKGMCWNRSQGLWWTKLAMIGWWGSRSAAFSMTSLIGVTEEFLMPVLLSDSLITLIAFTSSSKTQRAAFPMTKNKMMAKS